MWREDELWAKVEDLGRQYGALYARYEALREGVRQLGTDPDAVEAEQEARRDSPMAPPFGYSHRKGEHTVYGGAPVYGSLVELEAHTLRRFRLSCCGRSYVDTQFKWPEPAKKDDDAGPITP